MTKLKWAFDIHSLKLAFIDTTQIAIFNIFILYFHNSFEEHPCWTEALAS